MIVVPKIALIKLFTLVQVYCSPMMGYGGKCQAISSGSYDTLKKCEELKKELLGGTYDRTDGNIVTTYKITNSAACIEYDNTEVVVGKYKLIREKIQ